MALKTRIEDLKEVPEEHRGFYRHEESEDGEGHFILDVESANGWEIRDTSKLRKALQTERSQRETAEKLLAKVGYKWNKKERSYTGEVDLEDAMTALERLRETAEAGDGQPDFEARVKAIEEQLGQKFSKQIKLREEEIGGLESQLHEALVEREIDRAIAAAKPLDRAQPLVRKWVESQVRLAKRDDRRVVEVIDESKRPRISPSSDGGELMTVLELAQEARQQFPEAFARGVESTGSGAGRTAVGSGGAKSRGSMDSAQRAAYIAKHGAEAYLSLPE